MSKQRIQIGIIVVGVIVIGISLGIQFAGKKNARKEVPASPVSPVFPSALGVGIAGLSPSAQIKYEMQPLAETIVKKQKLSLARSWGRNPFVPKSTGVWVEEVRSAPLAGLFVNAIILREGEGVAMINDEIVRPGDTFRGYKVVRIDLGGITLERGEEKVVIPYGK